MSRFVLFSLGIALILLCQGLMKSDGADRFQVDDGDDGTEDFYKWMLIYLPILLALCGLIIAIVAYTHELNMVLHLIPIIFLIIMLSVMQYLIQFVFKNREKNIQAACSYFLVAIMAVVAIVTPFYASRVANTGCCAVRVSQRRKQKDYGVYTLPEIARGDLTIQESVASPVARIRLSQTRSPSKSSSSFIPSSPEREVQVIIHAVPTSPARQSVTTSSPARCALSPTSSPSSGSINEAYSLKSDGYAPLPTGSTASSDHSKKSLESIPASPEHCAPVHTTVIMEKPLGSDEDEHAV